MKLRKLAVMSFAVMCMCIALVGCSDAQSSTQDTTQTESSSSTEAPSTNSSSQSSSSSASDSSSAEPKKLESIQGTICTGETDDKGNQVIAEQTARDIFTFTMKGKQYSLPFAVQDLIDDGWVLSDQMSFDDNKTIDANTGLERVVLLYNGDKQDSILIDFFNFGTSANWKDTTCTGIRAEYKDKPTQIEMKLGTKLGSNADEAKRLYGYAEGTEIGKELSTKSLLLVNKDGSITKDCYGKFEIDYSIESGEVSSMHFELSGYPTNPLLDGAV